MVPFLPSCPEGYLFKELKYEREIMKVKELIAILEDKDPNADVLTCDGLDGDVSHDVFVSDYRVCYHDSWDVMITDIDFGTKKKEG